MSDAVQLPSIRSTDVYVEPHLSADPLDPQHLVAVAMALMGTDSVSNRRLVVYESFDSGETWTAEQVSAMDDLEPIDVWSAFATDGALLVSSMGRQAATDRGLASNVRVLRRESGSTDWLEPVAIPTVRGGGNFDHATITTNRSYSPTYGYVYVCGYAYGTRLPGTRDRLSGIGCSRSENGGRSFAPPSIFGGTNIDLLMPSAPAFFDDGTLLMGFSLLALDPPGGGQRVLDRKLVGAIRSDDGAHSYLPFGVLAIEEGVSWTDVGVDQTLGANHERAYVVWHQNGAHRPGVLLSYSADGGRLWTEPQILDTDGQMTFWSSNIEVANNGNVGVLYVRRPPETLGCYDLRFRASVDGGETFAPAVQVAKQGDCEGGEGSGAESAVQNLAVWQRWRHGGEYVGMTTDAEGRFHVLWAQPTDDPLRFRLLTRRIELVTS